MQKIFLKFRTLMAHSTRTDSWQEAGLCLMISSLTGGQKKASLAQVFLNLYSPAFQWMENNSVLPPFRNLLPQANTKWPLIIPEAVWAHKASSTSFESMLPAVGTTARRAAMLRSYSQICVQKLFLLMLKETLYGAKNQTWSSHVKSMSCLLWDSFAHRTNFKQNSLCRFV